MEKDAVSQGIAQRLERFRQKSWGQAGSLISSVFGDSILLRGAQVGLGSLIRLVRTAACAAPKTSTESHAGAIQSDVDCGVVASGFWQNPKSRTLTPIAAGLWRH